MFTKRFLCDKMGELAVVTMDTIFHLSLNQNPPGCPNADLPHVHGHHELLFCTAGEGGQMADRRNLPLHEGDLFFFPAGTNHCSVFWPGRKFECFVLDFQSRMFTPAVSADREVLDVVDKMAWFRGKVPLSVDGRNAVRGILDDILIEFQRKEPAYRAVLKMMTMRLMISIARDEEFRNQGRRICPPPSHHDVIREVLHYLDPFYMKPITIESVLEFCPMSRSHFHAVFKRATGKTLIEYLTGIRLAKAKQLLVGTEASVAEVAAGTGFKTPSYFGQVFREQTGLTPGEYRRLHSSVETSPAARLPGP